MSLKAKLEAVIYAAEEPVTLAQLAALFTADTLALKAEQAAAAGSATAGSAETLPLLEERLAYLDGDRTQVYYAAEPIAADGDPAGPDPEAVLAEAAPELADPPDSAAALPEPTDPIAEQAAEAASTDSEGELRRQARQRDREVRTILTGLLDELIADCAADGRGIEIREIAGGYRMATKPECHDAVRMFVRSLKPVLKLSLPALETLAVIAYKQPVTAPEVNEIRGVESNATLGSLLSRKLIATAGRKQVIGRPILYKTTREFLLRFGLKDINELPSMEEFEKMAAIELDESAADGPAAESGFEEPSEIAEANLDFSEAGEDDSTLPAAGNPEAAPAAAATESDIEPNTEAAQSAPSPAENAETEALPQ